MLVSHLHNCYAGYSEKIADNFQGFSHCMSAMQATLKDLQTTLKVAKSKEAASLPKEAKQTTALPSAALDLESGVNADEHQALLQQQQQQQQQERSVLESRLQYNDALIDERDEGIQDIQRNIQDIQEMFQVGLQQVCQLKDNVAQGSHNQILL